MDFQNGTLANARFLNTVFGEDELLGCVITRPVFDIEGEELRFKPGERFPIEAEPMETPCGVLPGDMPFLTGGVDLLIDGQAYAPNGEAVQSLTVEIRAGERFRRSILVYGDRVWESAGGELKASAPEPFRSMPLSYANAFGGRLSFDEGELPCQTNPDGKGYYLTREQADGQPLPNLEDPEAPITSFEDHPDPVGTAAYPREWSLCAQNAADVDEDEENPRLTRIKPLFFNAAHPRMIIPPGDAPQPGEMIEVSHVTPDGSLRFAMPVMPLHLHVQLEDRHYLFPLHVDQIGVMPEQRRVFIAQRCVFLYRMRRRERRLATLYVGPVPDELPPDYVPTLED